MAQRSRIEGEEEQGLSRCVLGGNRPHNIVICIVRLALPQAQHRASRPAITSHTDVGTSRASHASCSTDAGRAACTPVTPVASPPVLLAIAYEHIRYCAVYFRLHASRQPLLLFSLDSASPRIDVRRLGYRRDVAAAQFDSVEKCESCGRPDEFKDSRKIERERYSGIRMGEYGMEREISGEFDGSSGDERFNKEFGYGRRLERFCRSTVGHVTSVVIVSHRLLLLLARGRGLAAQSLTALCRPPERARYRI